jgi:hypothetical protein
MFFFFSEAARAVKIWWGEGADVRSPGWRGNDVEKRIYKHDGNNNSPELRAAGLIVAPSAPVGCAEYMTRRSKPAVTAVAAAAMAATCREIVGLATFQGWLRCRRRRPDLQIWLPRGRGRVWQAVAGGEPKGTSRMDKTDGQQRPEQRSVV